MLAVHADALSGVGEAYHNFMLRYVADAEVVYAFVEGRDDPSFYRHHINAFLPANWTVEFMMSRNRRGVITAYNSFDWRRFAREQICFFVDRDMSELVGEQAPEAPNVYVTDDYSCEHTCVSEDVYMAVLEDVYGLVNLSGQERNQLRSMFRTDLDEFVQVATPIMALMAASRRVGGRPLAANVDLKKVVSFSNGRLSRVGLPANDNQIQQAIIGDLKIDLPSPHDLTLASTDISARNERGRLISGKYLVWFVVRHILDVVSNLGGLTNTYQVAPKAYVNLSDVNYLMLAASKTRCPNSLKVFIEANYMRYVKDYVERHRLTFWTKARRYLSRVFGPGWNARQR